MDLPNFARHLILQFIEENKIKKILEKLIIM